MARRSFEPFDVLFGRNLHLDIGKSTFTFKITHWNSESFFFRYKSLAADTKAFIGPKTWSFLLESKNTISYLLERMWVSSRFSDNRHLTFLDKHSCSKKVVCLVYFLLRDFKVKQRPEKSFFFILKLFLNIDHFKRAILSSIKRLNWTDRQYLFNWYVCGPISDHATMSRRTVSYTEAFLRVNEWFFLPERFYIVLAVECFETQNPVWKFYLWPLQLFMTGVPSLLN